METKPESNTTDPNEPHQEQHELMTKPEVARMLRKSIRTIEHWVNAGYISSIRISHSVLFDRNQVLADVKRFRTGPMRRT